MCQSILNKSTSILKVEMIMWPLKWTVSSMGLVTNLLESQVARMSKIQDQNPRKPNAICNYPLRSCSTTGGGRQPSEDHIEDSMDIGEKENAMIILPLLCSLWHFGGGQFMFPVAVIGMISLFNSVSGGYMHKSICNSMLLGLNAFYEWGRCFLSEPWYDDPVRICFGSPMCVNGSVIPDCWALRPFYWSIMWQVLCGRWKFLRWNCTSVLWLNTMQRIRRTLNAAEGYGRSALPDWLTTQLCALWKYTA